ncbi:MAG TPA: ATP-dependent zinc metalloprotease FtsH [Chthoniobacteraceae bacterium]|jgi:cell division protease FtsH|nr:ATP-dependent zinc metalloprotease FtsH [Chthoniobacteraceae bacterium]
MAQPEPRNPNNSNRPPRNNGGGGPVPDPNFNWRGLILFSIAVALIAGAYLANAKSSAFVKLPYPNFVKLLEEKDAILINEKNPFDLVRDTQQMKEYIQGTMKMPDGTYSKFQTEVNLEFVRELNKLLEAHGIIANQSSSNNALAATLLSLLPIALLVLIVFFIFRQQIRMAGKGALNFGKSKARMLSREKNKVTFKDVAGVEEAKDEVQEIVEFLRDPKKFQKLGGRIPKGVLMVGPPGTGKTLLARAIAGEADVPFFSISGSDFVEMFVGVGASRVRDMFEQGKKSAPCIIFIDEIDAVGRHRGHGLGGGHDEREQTLNALLVEMDGFDTQEGVIIIAATNRPDVLDPALLRPGRFDRQITVNLPDVKGREEILRVHARKVKLAEDVDLAVIARGTPGYSGAELANVVNEAALLAARRNLKGITRFELEEARDKVRWGRERRSLAMSEKEKTSTAWHEAGHAVASVLLKHTHPLHKVTIIPRGHALGLTMSLPEGDVLSFKKLEALDNIAMTAAGRIAEELFIHDVSTGAAGDIKQMTRMARRMVCEWGMSEKLGMIEYGGHEDQVFLGRDINRSRDYSEQTAQEIDREVRQIVDEQFERAKAIIHSNQDKIELIVNALMEFETLEGSQVRDILEHGRMLNPPAPPPKPPTPPPLLPQREEGDIIAPDLPPGLTGAPA